MDKDWRPRNTGDEFPPPRTKLPSKRHHKLPEFEAGDDLPSERSSAALPTIESNDSRTKFPILSGAKRPIIIVGVSLLVLVAFVLFIIMPAVRGYATYSAMKDAGVPEEYLTNMQGLLGAKEKAEEDAKTTRSQLTQAQTELSACTAQRQSIEATCRQTTDELHEEIEVLRLERDVAQEAADEGDQALADAGRRICCVARIENPAINAYAILDGKITCVSEGGEPISC